MKLLGRCFTRVVTAPTVRRRGDVVTHAYVVTFHKAQGIAVRDAFVLTYGTLDREHAYTGMSRGADGNQLYITTDGLVVPSASTKCGIG